MKKLYLLDAFALIYRAHFAFIRNPRFNSKGMNTSATLGFMNSLLDIINNQDPSHIAVVFDSPGKGIREGIFSEYKANREKMPEDIRNNLPYIKQLLEAMNIPIVSLSGYEADDLIGTLAKKAEKKGYITYMMTPDKDFAQLVSENIFIYKPARMGNPPEILDVAKVNEKFNIEKPEQVIDILGLWGDAIDNIPGVPGIGEKTAKKLIAQYGSIENLLKNTKDLKGKQKENVENFADQALLSKKLATIITDCDVNFDEKLFSRKKPSENDVLALLSELEFKTMAKRLLGKEIQKTSPKVAKITKSGQLSLFGFEEDISIEKQELDSLEFDTIDSFKQNYILINTYEKHIKFVEKLNAQKQVCFDTETSSLNVRHARLLGISFSFKKNEAYYCVIPQKQEEKDGIIHLYNDFFSNNKILKIAHNLKFDLAILKYNNIIVSSNCFDTMIASYLLHPEQRHSMDRLAENYLNYRTIPIEQLIGKKGKNQASLASLPAESIKNYACEDADITFQLYEILSKKINEQKLEELFHKIEMPLIPVLMEMENEGIKLDVLALNDFSKSLLISTEKLKNDIISDATTNFNIDSPKQLGEILFDILKLSEKPKKTKTGQYKTDEATLQKLKNKHQIISRLLEYRTQKKLKSTYVDALPKLIEQKTNRIHTNYLQAGTVTGRLSSNNPNLQNIPIRTKLGKEIRKAFIPRGEDYSLLAADYSQIELRVIASLSGDESIISAFNKNLDIHKATAAKVFSVELDEVTNEMRSKAKMVNFGIIYGISPFGLSQRLNIRRAEAKEIIDNYFEKFPDIKTYINNMTESAREKGFVETIKNRRRYLNDINSKNATLRGFAERNATNAPIQGSAADIIKIAMINIHKAMKSLKLKSRMLLQVHDELIFDMHKDEKDILSELVNTQMSNAVKLNVPLKVEIGIADNWLDAH